MADPKSSRRSERSMRASQRTAAQGVAHVELLDHRVLLSAATGSEAPALAPTFSGEVATGATILRTRIDAPAAGVATSNAASAQLNGGGLQFNLIPAVGMSQQAIDGFQEAADLWSAVLVDDILVNINIDFTALDPGVLGSTGSTSQGISLTNVRNALTSDATSADDDTAVANLPSGSSLSLYTSDATTGDPEIDNNGTANNTILDVNTANAKALGVRAADDAAVDGSISFSTNFTFDFNRSDGIAAESFDFVGIAAHEIGHLLGFVSGADIVDAVSGEGPDAPEELDVFRIHSTLDLFRFSTQSLAAGADIDVRADTDAKFFSIDGGATQLTTFSTGSFNGDGQQASHWKDDLGIGIMDPTAGRTELLQISSFDLQAFDVMGWDTAAATPLDSRLVGVDFGPGGSTPNHWRASSAVADVTLTNLVDENGDTTPIDLVVDFVGGTDIGTSAATFPAEQQPQHVQSLAGIDGSVSTDGDLNLTFQDLTPGSSYEIFLFGGDAFFDHQLVTLVGESTMTFNQLFDGNTLLVNAAPGSSDGTLDSLGLVVVADVNGEIKIAIEPSLVQPSSFYLSVAGVAIRPTAQLSGIVFNDVDQDGAKDAAEAGLPDVLVYLDNDDDGVLDTTTVPTVRSATSTLPILDDFTIVSEFPVTGLGPIEDLDVGLNITHPFAGDLDIFLISPLGTRISLSSRNGSGGDNYTGTIFDDEAAASIDDGDAPFTGRFRPESPLSGLDGESPNGVWTLEITDAAAGDAGTLNGWSLTFNNEVFAEPHTLSDASGAYHFDGLVPGSYHVRSITPSPRIATGPTVHNVTLANGRDVAGLDFGSFQNAPPVLAGFTSPQTYTENAAAKVLAPLGTVTDSDSATLDGGQLTVKYTAGGQGTDRLTIRNQGNAAGQVGVSGNTIRVGGVAVATFAGGTGVQPLVINFNADARLPRVQAVLRNILYQNVSDNPTAFGAAPSRTVNYVLTDGDGGTSVAVNQTLNVTAVNDKPVLGAITTPQTYRENAPARQLAPQGTVTDLDSANFAGGKLIVRYTAGGLGSDRLTIRNQGTGAGKVGVSGNTVTFAGAAIGSFAGGSGLQQLVITFNSSAKVGMVLAVLRNVFYQNISDNPTNFGANPSRTVNYTLTDGDGGTSVAVNQTLNITAVNDASVVGNFADASTYTAGAGATILDTNATLADADSANFAGGNLVLMFSAGGVGSNRLAIRNQGTGANQVGVNGSNVTFAGTVIGTLNANAGVGLNALIVTFTPAATPAAVQALLRNLTYQSTIANPTGPKTLTLKVRDGDGGLATVNKTLNIAPALLAAPRSSAAFAAYAEWESAL